MLQTTSLCEQVCNEHQWNKAAVKGHTQALKWHPETGCYSGYNAWYWCGQNDAKFQEQIKQWVTLPNVKCCSRHFCTLKSENEFFLRKYTLNIVRYHVSQQQRVWFSGTLMFTHCHNLYSMFFFSCFYCINYIHVQGSGITQPSLIVPTHFSLYGVSAQGRRKTTKRWIEDLELK